MQAEIQSILAKANIPGQVQSIKPCVTGGNNRTYLVTTTHGALAAKQYFRDPNDSRDRLSTEFAFLRYAVDSAPGFTPAPLALDLEMGLGIYEYIDGNPIPVDDINWRHVQNAASFFIALNELEVKKKAKGLPIASEACFSISEHLKMVGGRLRMLLDQVPVVQENLCAYELIRAISAYWAKLSENILAATKSFGIDPNELIPENQRCVSPSDFGFHNAMVMADKTTRFLDFEYAGWDDPAKMSGDFFAQLAVPVPGEYFERFVNSISVAFPQPDKLIQRAILLRPAYQVKWCCIALNVFLPVNLKRRMFANPHLDEIELKRAQLAKAQFIMQSLTPLH